MHAVPAAAQGLTAGEYKVGFITENTGAIASAGQSFWNGAQLAAEEVKAKKYLGGASIALEPKESGSDAARAIQAMQPVHRRPLRHRDELLHPLAGRRFAEADRGRGAKMPLVIFGATAAGSAAAAVDLQHDDPARARRTRPPRSRSSTR